MEFFMRRQDFRRLVRTAFFVSNENIVNRALKLCHAHAIARDGAVIQELCEKRAGTGA
jgi:ABC-type proline/glycine betaine transport system ATPase subunit